MILKAKISGVISVLKTPIAYTSVDARNFWPMPPVQKTQQHKQFTSRDTIYTAKRCFDLIAAIVVTIFAAPIMLCIAVLILLKDGRPIFFISERMKAPSTPFQLVKFRTMRSIPDSKNIGVTGGDKVNRITRTGRLLRKYRLDELPQLINVFLGDMSFVGPRPPLRQYTEAFPGTYRAVLQSRPGVTGLATLHFHRHEERLIARTKSATETEAIYTTRCIPRKATLDLIYQRHASVWFDAKILWKTALCVLKR